MIFVLCQGVKNKIHLSLCCNSLIDTLMQQIIHKNNVTKHIIAYYNVISKYASRPRTKLNLYIVQALQSSAVFLVQIFLIQLSK